MGEITKALDWSTFSFVEEVFRKKKVKILISTF